MYIMNSEECCSICLCEMKDDKYVCQKYKCNHSFHKNCISDWHGTCPLCRANEIYDPIKKRIKGFKDLPRNVPSQYIKIYLEKWGNNQCQENNHTMFFKHTYGVIGICETCQSIQCFNLSHPC